MFYQFIHSMEIKPMILALFAPCYTVYITEIKPVLSHILYSKLHATHFSLRVLFVFTEQAGVVEV